MAIKLLDAAATATGQAIDGDVQGRDFVLVDSETFFTGNPKEYDLVTAATLGRGLLPRLFAWLSIICRPKLLWAIFAFISHRPTSPLSIPYFSTVPYRFGRDVVKYVVEPLDFQSGPSLDDPNGLALALRQTLAQGPASFRFGIDLQVDPSTQPIEDPSIRWSGADGAKRIWLADIRIPRQSVDAASPLAENLSFSPWNTLDDHQPVGFINRARQATYRDMAQQRHSANDIVPEQSSGAPATYGSRPVVQKEERHDPR